MAEGDFTGRLEAVLHDLEPKGEAELAACEARRESWSNRAHYYLGWVDAPVTPPGEAGTARYGRQQAE